MVDALKLVLHASALRARHYFSQRSLGRRTKSDETDVRFWFCFQPFKASGLDWPVVRRHHTCHARSQQERRIYAISAANKATNSTRIVQR